MANGDIWEVAFTFVENREQGEIVLHFKMTSESEPDLNDTAQALLTETMGLVAGVMELVNPTTVSLVSGAAHRIKGAAGTSRYFTRFGASNGSVSSDSVGAQLAMLISKYTDNNSGHQRGRTYWPFVARSIQNSGQIGNDVAMSVQSAIDALYFDAINDDESNVWQQCIYSRAEDEGYQITDWVLRPVLVLQRRRVVHKQPYHAG